MELKFKGIDAQLLFVSRAIAVCISFICIVIFVSYFIDIEWVYRPIVDGPATHPMTALLLLILALNCFLFSISRRVCFGLLALSGFCLAFYFLGWVTNINHIDNLLSANQTFNNLLHDNSPMEMGRNTAYMLGVIFVAHVVILSSHFGVVAQILTLGSAFLPFVSIIGYLYRIDSFYGQMSPTTTILGIALSVATALQLSKQGVIYALLAPNFGARLVRWQLLVGITLFVSSGYVIAQINDDEKFISLYVATICFFFLLIMTVSAVSYEHYDMHRRSLEDELSLISITDKLTNVYNRLALDKDLKKQFGSLHSKSDKVSILLVDVDHFKRINDVYGHLAGDKVLQTIAKILKSSIRSTDSIYRYGGEEFLVMLVQCDLVKATEIAEELRRRVADQDLTPILGNSNRTNVTVSIGCGSLSDATSVDSALTLADAAMYTAKRNGRNQVYVAETTAQNCQKTLMKTV